MSEETNKSATNETVLEMRFRRMWKHDIDAHYRGIVQDVLAHVETASHNAIREPLSQQSESVRDALKNHSANIEARIAEMLTDFRNSLENEIAQIAVKVLDEYKHELRKEYLAADCTARK